MKQLLIDKIETLNKQREQLIAQVNAVSGAIQVLQELLAESEEEVKGKQ